MTISPAQRQEVTLNSKTFNIGHFIIALTLFFALQAWLGYRDILQLSFRTAISS